jgi:hypothetical protein
MLKIYSSLSLVVLFGSTVACSGGDDPGSDGQPVGAGGSGASGGADGDLPDPNGGREWPAGHADPCAVPLDTPYHNDELCLEPPPPHLGFQTHFGPEDYDDPEDVRQFLLAPGAENTVCQYHFTPHFEGVRYGNEQHTRLRSGTHHMIVWTANQDLPDPPPARSLSNGCQNPFEYLFTTGAQSGIGEGGGILDIPLPGGDPPENEGTARLIHPNRSIAVEMHYINTTPEPILREAWINTIYADPSSVTTLIDPMFLIGSNINVPPGGSQIVRADSCAQPAIPPGSAESRVRILGMTGHAHANTTRITAWIDRAASGQRDRIYEAYDWAEPLNAQFSSQHQNPQMGDGINDGAHTGQLWMDPGDTFSWECEIHNQQNVTLRFGNLAYEAEMCNIFGFHVPGGGGMWACFR